MSAELAHVDALAYLFRLAFVFMVALAVAAMSFGARVRVARDGDMDTANGLALLGSLCAVVMLACIVIAGLSPWAFVTAFDPALGAAHVSSLATPPAVP